MNSTLNKDRVPPYLGADLTDRYSRHCRAVDVCGLTRSGNNTLMASFWFWRWDAAPEELDVTVIGKEVGEAQAVMLDGPQGLAAEGNPLRECERQAAAVGKTPNNRPALDRPFAGFVCSSLDMFAALRRSGIQISPPQFLGGVSEVYPGHVWKIFAGRFLSKKSSDNGRCQRKRILKALGVSGLPELPTHDQNDACLAAVLAAAAEGAIPGISLKGIGCSLFADPDGTLREGLMVVPDVTAAVCNLISEVLCETPILDIAVPVADAVAYYRAECLLDRFVAKALKGHPQVCTYSWAYRHLFNKSYGKWSQSYARQVIDLAQRTQLTDLPFLGPVRLDAFIVADGNGLPSNGHWNSAKYDREDWERILGSAKVLHSHGSAE